MASWRVTVKCEDQDSATAFKERFFKQLYEERGAKLVFEVPSEAQTEPILAAAKESGFTAEKEEFQDPIEDAEPVDFW